MSDFEISDFSILTAGRGELGSPADCKPDRATTGRLAAGFDFQAGLKL